MPGFDFAEYYKRISNTELFDILDNAEEYQLSALEAATSELSNRKLSEVEINMAKEPLVLKQLRKDKQAEKNKVAEEKIKAAGESIFYAIKPVDTDEQIVNKKILFIIIICGVYFVLTLIKEFSTIISFITAITESPFLVSFYLLPLITTPIALVTFWKRKAIGWSLLVLCVTFSATSNLIMMYKILSYKSSGLYYDNLYRSPVRGTDIFYLFILIGILYVVCKKNIRDIYNIDIPKMAGLIFIGAMVSFIFTYGIL